MIKSKNNWDILYEEAKINGCSTMEDIVEFLKKHYQKSESILYSEYNDMTEGDEDNF